MLHAIKISTDAPGLPSHEKLSGHRSKEVAETQAQIMSVALNQPHRRGIKDKDQSRAGLREELWEAGRRYGEVCRQGKAAKGFATYQAREQVVAGGATLTDAQIAAMNQLAVQRWADAEGVLRGIIGRLPKAMEMLCFDELEPRPTDHGVLAQGLYRLALYFGKIDQGINRGKGA